MVSYQPSNLKAGAVQGERPNYYLLSVIDVYTRKVLAWLFQGTIRQLDLINLLRRVNLSHELKGVILRNDNGSQFIAHSVRNFLKSSEVKQNRAAGAVYARGHSRGELVY